MTHTLTSIRMNRLAMAILMSLFAAAAGAQAQENVAAGAAAVGSAAKEVGRELQKLEQSTVETGSKPIKEAPEVPLQEVLSAPAAEEEESAAPAAEGEQPLITRVDVRGDAEILDRAGLRLSFEGGLLGRRPAAKELKDAARVCQEDLVKKGYSLATVTYSAADSKDGVAVFKIDAGRIGTISIMSKSASGPQPFAEKYFSESQIRRRAARLESGSYFYYPDIYSSFYEINAHPDLNTDVDLKVRKAKEGEEPGRYSDVTFQVTEDLPFHAALEFGNDGTDVTEEWRTGLTLQYLNLARHDDAITLNFPVSLDFETIRSFSGSYFIPHHMGNGGSFSLFGGYSELQADEIVPLIDLDGEGWFVGGQGSYVFLANDRHYLEGGLGIVHRYVEDTLLVNQNEPFPRDVALTPITLSLTWVPQRPDRLGGKNFLVSATSVNIGGFLGSSDDEDFELQRENAKADYFVERLQYGRLQPIFHPERKEEDRWVLYTKADAQLTTEPLISAEQKSIGGYSTVRGYLESEYLADQGLTATLEFRSPIRRTSFLPGKFTRLEDPAKDYERLQFVTFLDAGYGTLIDALSGQDDSFTLASVGAGFRLSISNYLQARFDWGFPLEETEDSDSTGRGHISVQALF